jgi:hypothetical protein
MPQIVWGRKENVRCLDEISNANFYKAALKADRLGLLKARDIIVETYQNTEKTKYTENELKAIFGIDQ